MSFRNVLAFTVLFGLSIPLTAFASSVSAIKNKQVVITMDTETYQVGQVVYGMTGPKKTALIQIQKIRGNKALGTITRGHVAVGGTTMVRTAPAARQRNEESSYNRTSYTHTRKKWSGGILASYAMQSASMTVQTLTDSESAKFTGSAMGFKGFVDYDYSSNVTIRGAFGLEPLNTKASTTLALCGNGTTNACKFNYNFIAVEGSVHYNLVTKPSRYWIGLGYSYLLDGGHSNNVPNVQLSGGSSQMILFGAGADFSFRKGFIPVALEYGMFPGGGGVTISSIFFRAGYGWNF